MAVVSSGMNTRNQAMIFLITVAGHVGQAEIPAVVAVGQLQVIQAEQVQDGRVQVVDADAIDDGLDGRSRRLRRGACRP